VVGGRGKGARGRTEANSLLPQLGESVVDFAEQVGEDFTEPVQVQ
jgi:hypothetical protein